MPTQRSVATRFWTSLSLRGCSPHTRLVMLYCLTCPRSNMAGFFRFSLDDCSEETGLTKKQVESSLLEAHNREFLELDCDTHYLWVYKRVSFEFPNGAISDRQRECIRKIIDDVPNSPIKQRFCESYKGLGNPFANGYTNGTDPSLASASASVTTPTPTTLATVVDKSTPWPTQLEDVRSFLLTIQAPDQFFNQTYWLRIDQWLGSSDSSVYYFDELKAYLAWIASQNGHRKHKDLLRGFRNWLSTCSRWKERDAQRKAVHQRGSH